jgi:HK97 gp10 family phage protein
MSTKGLTSRIASTKRKLSQCVEKALFASCIIVEGDAVERVPVDTGNLKNSITHDVKMKGENGGEGIVGTNVDYAPWVEFGTRHMLAQPYLRPSLLANEHRIASVFSREINVALKSK